MIKLPDLSTQERPIPGAAGGLATYRPDFGGREEAARALMQTGKQIENAGDELFARAKVEQDKIDTLKAEDAFTKLREKQLDLTMGEQNGYARLRGAAAVNTPVMKDWSKRFSDEATAIEQTLQTDGQKLKFRERFKVADLQFKEGILHHTVRESDSYARDVYQGTVQSEIRQAVSEWQNANAVGLSLARIDSAVQAQAERNGWPAELANAEKLKQQGAVHSAVIQQALASGNFKYAEDWYKNNKANIDLPTAKMLEVAVRDGTQKQLAAGYTTEYLALRDNSQALTLLADKVLADPTLDDTRKNTIRSHILTRIDRLDKQAATQSSMLDKEVERQIAQINSVTLSGFEPTLEQVAPLINMSRGTRFEPEVNQMVNTINLTREFRKMTPAQQAAKITEMTVAARQGGTLDPKIRFSPDVEKHAQAIDTAAQRFGIDPTIMRAQITQESGGRVDAVSPAGARGISQFIPGTAKRYNVDVNDPVSSISGQANYMRDLLGMFGGDYVKALAAYNMGEGSREKGNGVMGLVAKHGDDWLKFAPKETQGYVANIMKMAGGARAVKFDVTTVQRFQAIHEAQLKELRESPVTYAVRQDLVPAGSLGAQPLDMADPTKLDYAALQARVSLAKSMETQYAAPMKPLTPEEVSLATSTLKNLDNQGRKAYFEALYQTSINNNPQAVYAGTSKMGPKDDVGGAQTYRAIMAQIAPGTPVLAHAGIAAARRYADPKQGDVADLILEGYRILNPATRANGAPESGKLMPLPSESAMRLAYDNTVRDAFAGNPDANRGYYETAKSIYAALSSKVGDADTSILDGARWKQAIEMSTGPIVRWNGKNTPLPYGLDEGEFKDRLKQNVTGLIASGRVAPGLTYAKVIDMRLEPIRDGVYVFREGDAVLADKTGRPVVIDLNRRAPWGQSQTRMAPTPAPTSEETAAVGGAYFGRAKPRGDR